MSRRLWPPSESLVWLVLFALLCAAGMLLFYGMASGGGYAGITALLIFPALFGALVSHAQSPDGQNPWMGCFVWPLVAVAGLAAFGWYFMAEGGICLLMVLPIWVVGAVGGATMQLLNRRRYRALEQRGTELKSAAWVSALVLAATLDLTTVPSWSTETVVRNVLIEASPEQIWPVVLSIPAIGENEGSSNFAQDVAGIPRPTAALLTLEGGQLVRKAAWGPKVRFDERITNLHPAKLLAWQFVFPDRSVQEQTDHHISPDGEVLKIVSGRYELRRLGRDKTLLKLSTEYRMRSTLGPYLRLWGDKLLGDIQINVLAIVKSRAELKTSLPPA
ncbi:MAG: hypothetical protein ABIO43_00545 [Sphingomicrobium sp.]